MPPEDEDLLIEEDIDETPEDDEDESPEDSIEDDEGEEGDGDEDAGTPAQGSAGLQGQESHRQPSRAQRRVETALREAREAKDRAANLERQLAGFQQQRQQPQETLEQRQARLDAMDPWDRERYEREEQDRRHQNDIARLRFETADQNDRTAFDALCRTSPVAAKLKSQVEDYLGNMRRSGTTAPRETILRFLIGDRALQNAGKSTRRNQQRADDNRQRQAGKPGNARSDQGGGREKGGLSERAARAKRLEDMQI